MMRKGDEVLLWSRSDPTSVKKVVGSGMERVLPRLVVSFFTGLGDASFKDPDNNKVKYKEVGIFPSALVSGKVEFSDHSGRKWVCNSSCGPNVTLAFYKLCYDGNADMSALMLPMLKRRDSVKVLSSAGSGEEAVAIVSSVEDFERSVPNLREYFLFPKTESVPSYGTAVVSGLVVSSADRQFVANVNTKTAQFLGSSRTIKSGRYLNSSMSFNNPVINQTAYAFVNNAITPEVALAVIELQEGVDEDAFHEAWDNFNRQVSSYAGVSIPEGTVVTEDDRRDAARFISKVRVSKHGWEGVSDEVLSNPEAKNWRNSSRSIQSARSNITQIMALAEDLWADDVPEDEIPGRIAEQLGVSEALVKKYVRQVLDYDKERQDGARFFPDRNSSSSIQSGGYSPSEKTLFQIKRDFLNGYLDESEAVGTLVFLKLSQEEAEKMVSLWSTEFDSPSKPSNDYDDVYNVSRTIDSGVQNFPALVSSANIMKLKLDEAGTFHLDMGHTKDSHEVYSSLRGTCDAGHLIAICKKGGFSYSDISSGVDFSSSSVLPELKKFLAASATFKPVADPVIKRSVATWVISGKELDKELSKWGLNNPGEVFSEIDVLGVDLDGEGDLEAPVQSSLPSGLNPDHPHFASLKKKWLSGRVDEDEALDALGRFGLPRDEAQELLDTWGVCGGEGAFKLEEA
jgi:hypothetical protein